DPEEVGLEGERVVEGRVEAVVDRLEGERERYRAVRDDLAEQLPRGAEEIRERDHAVDEPDPVGLFGVDHLAGQHHLERAPAADEAGQADSTAVAGDDPELHLGEAEARILTGDAEVAGECELEPAPEGEAVD